MTLSDCKSCKSCLATYVYKYVITPLFGIGFLLVLIFAWNTEDQFMNDLREEVAVIGFWALAWLAVLSLKLRMVSINQKSFTIKASKGEMDIDYKDVKWIYQTVFIRPVLISMKYWDQEAGKFRKILIMPEGNSGHYLYTESEFIKVLRKHLKRVNPDYSDAKEPLRWIPMALILITGFLPMLIIDMF